MVPWVNRSEALFVGEWTESEGDAQVMFFSGAGYLCDVKKGVVVFDSSKQDP